MIRVNQVRLSINEDTNVLKNKIAKKINISPKDILRYFIYRESVDARRKNKLYFVYTVDVEVKNESKILKKKNVTKSPNLKYIHIKRGDKKLKNRPVIVGMGPAGLFAGLILARRGYKPIIIERGKNVDERTKDVNEFWNSKRLNIESNVQFGEGGAGTFSDGKLTARTKDKRCRKVLKELIKAGSPEEIMYWHLPHIGTDKLKNVVKRIREEIIDLGGDVRFNTKLTDIFVKEGNLIGIEVNEDTRIDVDVLILATGHSARDTYEMLHMRKVKILQKPIAVGVRIEHPQHLIDKRQYNKFAGHPRLGAASYRLTHKTRSGRGVYTFCMCPGGDVISASSEEGGIVTNGMSLYARDKQNANSAILVQVYNDDYGSTHPLAGIDFQRKLEVKAFELGGGNYNAPIQTVGDFLEGKKTEELGSVRPTYTPGVTPTDLKNCLPTFVIKALREALPKMDEKIKGFAMNDALLTGVETRSSSPVRIERDRKSMESVNVKGLYPSGEGSGYAGGIISSAIDGIKAAENVIKKFKV